MRTGIAVLTLSLFMLAGNVYSPGERQADRPEPALAQTDRIIDEAAAIINSTRNDSLSAEVFGFEKRLVRELLSPEAKALYDEILPAAKNFEPFYYPAAQYGYEVLDRILEVYGAMILDHPEIENYFIIDEVFAGDKTVALGSKYFMPQDAEQQPADIKLLKQEAALFDAACDRIVERMPDGLSTYDRYRYLAAVISLTANYDYDFTGGWQVGTAYGAIVSGRSICQGYSRGFLALCERAGLWCATVEGVVDGTGHMWNRVRLDSGFYHADITWADEKGRPGSDEWLSYFMRTDSEISTDHTIVGDTLDVYEKNR